MRDRIAGLGCASGEKLDSTISLCSYTCWRSTLRVMEALIMYPLANLNNIVQSETRVVKKARLDQSVHEVHGKSTASPLLLSPPSHPPSHQIAPVEARSTGKVKGKDLQCCPPVETTCGSCAGQPSAVGCVAPLHARTRY